MDELKLPKEWFYDELLDNYRQRVYTYLKSARESKKKIRKLEIKVQRAQDNSDLESIAENLNKVQECVFVASAAEAVVANAREKREHLENHKVIRIGSATLDSLLNTEPDRFDYIEKDGCHFH